MRVLILLALLGSAFAAPKVSSRITGGSETTIEAYPFVVNMQYHEFNIWWTHTCGGVLLTSLVGITSANCVEGDSPSQWQALLGTSSASSGGDTHSFARFLLHEGHNGVLNDMALFRLTLRATFSTSVQVASIPGTTYVVPDNSSVTAVGWGSLSSGGAYPEQLRHATVNVINRAVCAERYAQLQTQPGYEDWPSVTESMICTGVLDIGGADHCDGDAGGPIVYQNNLVVGVISWGYRCGHPTYPGVNTNVASYSNWIVTNAGII